MNDTPQLPENAPEEPATPEIAPKPETIPPGRNAGQNRTLVSGAGERSCPNCGNAVPSNVAFCPNCGQAMPPQPLMRGQSESGVLLLTGSKAGDIAAGIATAFFLTLLASFVGVASSFLLLQGLSVILAVGVFGGAIALYFRWRKRYPIFARAYGYTILVLMIAPVVLSLGLLAVCLVVVGASALFNR